jgi:hypothetical protein
MIESGSGAVHLAADDVPPREPDALCDACGARGTVGRFSFLFAGGAPPAVHRFCAACWPAGAAALRARWEQGDWAGSPTPAGIAVTAATWDPALEMLREVERAAARGRPHAAADLARLAAHFRADAPDIGSPMPPEVAAFVRRYENLSGRGHR